MRKDTINVTELVLLIVFCALTSYARADIAAWNAVVSEDNPLHWYRFDETSGAVCTDHGSGGLNGNYDGVILAQAGFFSNNNAVQFTGSGVNSVVLNAANMDAPWTAEYIVMKKAKGSQALHDSGNYSIRIEQWAASGRVGLTHYGNIDYTFSTVGSLNQIIPLDEWTHLVFRRDASESSQVFINGLMVGTLDSVIPFPMGRIGSHNGTGDGFTGLLDEAVVYDRVLSDDEIQQHSLMSISVFKMGDFDLNGVVDIFDLTQLVLNWMDDCAVPDWCQTTDINHSTRVDNKDFALLSQNWLEGYIPPSPTNVIPRPVQVEMTDGTFQLQSSMQILVEQGSDRLEEIGNYLTDILNPATGLGLTVSQTTATTPPANSILLTTAQSDPALGDEGYELTATPNTLLIRASHPDGVFYGVQTLRQLLPYQIERDSLVEGMSWSFPCISIWDKPRFIWRGMHLDESRHFFGMEYVKKYIDYLAMYKMNTLHWHIDDDPGWRIEIPTYPLLTSVGAWRSGCSGEESPYGGFYTQSQVHDIVEYARRRNIVIVPEIEMPGHTQAVLAAYPEYSCTGGPFEVACYNWSGVVYDNVFCPSEATFTFLENLLTEIMVLFPGDYIHIGGDEVNKQAWQESAVAQQVMADNGLANENELQTWFISRISDFLVANGRKPIGWSEIINGGIPNNAVIMSWLGMSAGITAAQNGHDTIMSPTSHCYFDYSYESISTEKVYSFEPIPYELTETEAQHVLGAQGNVWTEWIFTPEAVDEKAIPRMTAMAEVTWSLAELKNWEDFQYRLQQHYLRLDELDVNYYYNWKVPGGPELKEPAQLTTTLGTYSDYLLDYAYDGSLRSYFWSNRALVSGDTITVTLDSTRLCDRIEIYMGTDNKPDDRLHSGVVEISANGTTFTEVGTITEMETVATFTQQMVKAARIRCTAGQSYWLILREVALE